MVEWSAPEIWAGLSQLLLSYGMKVVLAIAAWVGGRWLINLLHHVLVKGFTHFGQIELSLARSLSNIVSLTLNVILVLIILGIFGIDTSSLAAVLIGFGVALGIACGGIFSHFVAGIFLQSTKPWRNGDDIEMGGKRGRILSQGLLSTQIQEANGCIVHVGNQQAYSAVVTVHPANAMQTVQAHLHLAKPLPMRQALAAVQNYIAQDGAVQAFKAHEVVWQVQDVDSHCVRLQLTTTCPDAQAKDLQQALQLALIEWHNSISRA